MLRLRFNCLLFSFIFLPLTTLLRIDNCPCILFISLSIFLSRLEFFFTVCSYFFTYFCASVADAAYIRWLISVRFIALSISSLFFRIAWLSVLMVSFIWRLLLTFLIVGRSSNDISFIFSHLYRISFNNISFFIIFVIILCTLSCVALGDYYVFVPLYISPLVCWHLDPRF